MEMGFQEILSDIALKMQEQSSRQTSLFSATFPDQVQKICKEFLKEDYFFVTIGKSVEENILQPSPNERSPRIPRYPKTIIKSRYTHKTFPR